MNNNNNNTAHLNQPAIARFTTSTCDRGPHPIPRKRQISSQFHRIFSIKAGMRIVVAEGLIQANAILCAEGDCNIVSLCEQPLRINGSFGTSEYFTLDLALINKEATEIIYKVTSSNRLVEVENGKLQPPNWEFIDAWSKAHGFNIQVMTNDWIAQYQTRISNWKVLLGFAVHYQNNQDPKLRNEVYARIADAPGLTLATLHEQLNRIKETNLTSCVASLLHEGCVVAQLNKKVFTRKRGLKISE